MAPVVHGEKGTQKDLLESLRKEGYIRVRVDDEMMDLSDDITYSPIDIVGTGGDGKNTFNISTCADVYKRQSLLTFVL